MFGNERASFIPTLAVKRSLKPDEVKLLTARLSPGISYPKLGGAHYWRSNTIFMSTYGSDALTHAVSTWSDEQNRTILAFEPDGLLPPIGSFEIETVLPTEAEAIQTLALIGETIQALMHDQFAANVTYEPILISR